MLFCLAAMKKYVLRPGKTSLAELCCVVVFTIDPKVYFFETIHVLGFDLDEKLNFNCSLFD